MYRAKRILKKFKVYIECECKKVSIPGMEINDLKQEVAIQLIESFKTYDGKSSSEKNWALTIIRRRLYELWRHEVTRKRMPRDVEDNILSYVSFEQPISSHVDDEETLYNMSNIIPCEQYFGRSEFYEQPDAPLRYRQLINSVNEKLSELGKIIFQCKIDPPYGLFLMLMNENKKRKKMKKNGYITRELTSPTNKIIAKYTGLGLVDVQYCMTEIKSVVLATVHR